jgi:hypothetical protein
MPGGPEDWKVGGRTAEGGNMGKMPMPRGGGRSADERRPYAGAYSDRSIHFQARLSSGVLTQFFTLGLIA